MSVTAFIGLAAILFILGILFITKGTTLEENDAVAISSPEEIEGLKSTFSPSQQKESPDSEKEIPADTPSIELSKDTEVSPSVNVNQRSEIDELADKNKQLEQDLEMLKSENQKVKDSKLIEVGALEDKLSNIQREKEQLSKDHELIDELKVKGELAEKRYTENKLQQDELQKFISTLESEMAELVRAQKMGVDNTEFQALNNRLESSIATIETLKGENIALQGSNQGLVNDFEKTKEYNEHLVEKERFMEFELSKNRAQAFGLEKICEDFKCQIETLTTAASNK